MKPFSLVAIGLLALPLLADTAKEAAPGAPATKKEPVQDTYHGTVVTDPYRWLEDGKNKVVKEWSRAQNEHAEAAIKKLPGLDKIRAEVKEILSAQVVTHGSLSFRGGKLFALKRQPPKEQPFLVVLPGPDQPDKGRVILDPTDLDKKGTTAIDWFEPSPDGSMVAVSLSKSGSESGDLYLYDTESGKRVHEVIPRVQNGTAGGSMAWAPDGRGFYYTRYPRGKERSAEDVDFYQQLYFHKLGTPTDKDRYELGKDLPRIAEIKVKVHRGTGRVLCEVQKGDGGEFAHFVRDPQGKWRQFSDFPDKVVHAVFGPDGNLFVVSRADAPRGKILHLSFDDLDIKKAKVIIPEGKETVVTNFEGAETLAPTKTRLYVTYQLGGPSEIRTFDHAGKKVEAPKQLSVASVGGLTPVEGDDLIFGMESFVEPFGQYLFKAKTNETTRTPLATKPSVSFGDVKVTREFATSKDGTKVPVNILIPRGTKLDGNNPCVVTGYGGYGINIEPRFRPQLRVLLERGVIYAVANIRGGGEYGEAWHQAGNLTRKQNVFDDFTAALKHLIERKYTSSKRLGITGGSNGGLLMGAILTQHPGLVRVVVSFVGIYDSLRVELSPNGAFNVPEFGTVKNPDHFKALYAYSPYHNVKEGTKYPAVLFLTGANDPRVDPMQSRKMTARLQAATGAKAPILLRTSDTAGHGLDTSLSERISETSEVYAFLLYHLGVKVS